MLIHSTSDFAWIARKSRVQQGYSQKDFAKQIGMSYSWVQQFERGEIKPSLEAAIKVAAGIGHSITLTKDEPNPVIEQLFRELT